MEEEDVCNVTRQAFISMLALLTNGAVINTPIIAAVSGGADSVSLVNLLMDESNGKMGPECGRIVKADIIVVHINHQLRGAESDADAAFVEEVAASLGVKCIVEQAPVAHLPGNLEDNARKARYEILERIAEQHESEYICTGHTKNDQAETLLHRIIRGTSLDGLQGIHELCELRKTTIIRPMTRISREQVLAYLQTLEQPYRIDSSNADLRFTRNRIRHEVIPLLQSLNPQVVEALSRLQVQASQEAIGFRSSAFECLRACEQPRSGDVIVLNCQLCACGNRLIILMLKMIWSRERWSMGGMNSRHWYLAKEMLGGVDNPPIDLPGKIRIERRGNVVLIGPRAALLGQ